MLQNILENYNRRDFIVKKNINNLKKMPNIVNIQIKGIFLTENLSEKELYNIINIIELIEGLSKQKLVISGDANVNDLKYKYNVTTKKIIIKTLLNNFLLIEFLKYFIYIFMPIYKYKNNMLQLYKQKKLNKSKENIYYYDLKINYNNLFFGFTKELHGYLMIRFYLKNVDLNLVKEFLSLYGIVIKK